MKPAWLVPVLLLGCTAPPPPPEVPTIKSVPAALIADSGASLYVFEGPAEWWVDNVVSRHLPEPVDGANWIGLNTLKLILRHGLSQGNLSLIGHADFQPTAGYPTEATLFNPDSEAHRMKPGSGYVGFRVQVTAAYPADPLYVSVEWKFEKLTERSDPKTGKEKPRLIEPINSGTSVIPAGAAIVVRCPKPEGREYLLLLRISSLKKP